MVDGFHWFDFNGRVALGNVSRAPSTGMEDEQQKQNNFFDFCSHFGCRFPFCNEGAEMRLTATGWFLGSVVVWWSLILWLGTLDGGQSF